MHRWASTRSAARGRRSRGGRSVWTSLLEVSCRAMRGGKNTVCGFVSIGRLQSCFIPSSRPSSSGIRPLHHVRLARPPTKKHSTAASHAHHHPHPPPSVVPLDKPSLRPVQVVARRCLPSARQRPACAARPITRLHASAVAVDVAPGRTVSLLETTPGGRFTVEHLRLTNAMFSAGAMRGGFAMVWRRSSGLVAEGRHAKSGVVGWV